MRKYSNSLSTIPFFLFFFPSLFSLHPPAILKLFSCRWQFCVLLILFSPFGTNELYVRVCVGTEMYRKTNKSTQHKHDSHACTPTVERETEQPGKLSGAIAKKIHSSRVELAPFAQSKTVVHVME